MPISIELVTHEPTELSSLQETCARLHAEEGIQITALLETPEVHQRTQTRESKETVPLPDPDLGRHLESIAEVRLWLGHPSNWKDTRLFIIFWDGNVPKIARTSVDQLDSDLFCQLVIREQVNRKRRPTFEPVPEGVMG